LYLCGVSTLRYSVAGVTASGIEAAKEEEEREV
jgi:hypothetical protein